MHTHTPHSHTHEHVHTQAHTYTHLLLIFKSLFPWQGHSLPPTAPRWCVLLNAPLAFPKSCLLKLATLVAVL